MTKAPQCIDAALEKAALKPEEVDLYLLHQANCRIIQSVAKRLGQPEEKFPMNLNECGNTSAASLPILMAQLDEQGKLNRGRYAGTVWFGCRSYLGLLV